MEDKIITEAKERGIEINPAQNATCNKYTLQRMEAITCGKPAIVNAAKRTAKGWRMYDLCADCLKTF